MSIASAVLLLFLVMDPLGNIPFFLSALSRVEPGRRTFVILRELLIAFVILVVFLFAGSHLLRLMHISEPALTIAGGVILFLISLRMVFPWPHGLEEDVDGEPFIVPLAVPYVAGPSALATVVLLMSKEPDRWYDWVVAVSLAWLISAGIILLGSHLSRLLGRKGLIAMERLMGMVLVAVAVQMFLTGIQKAFPLLAAP